jgi:glycerophosphoryl diester phosphodiesterase
VRLNLEIKSKKAVVPTIMKLKNYIVKKDWQVDDFLITSFDYGLLRMVKELLPEIRIGLLSIFPPFHYIGQAQSLQAYSLHPYSFFVRNWIVANAHKHGLKVIPYTVNNPKEIKRLQNIGVDGIISDFPDRVRKVEGNMKYYGL